jgi:hypothetical protein
MLHSDGGSAYFCCSTMRGIRLACTKWCCKMVAWLTKGLIDSEVGMFKRWIAKNYTDLKFKSREYINRLEPMSLAIIFSRFMSSLMVTLTDWPVEATTNLLQSNVNNTYLTSQRSKTQIDTRCDQNLLGLVAVTLMKTVHQRKQPPSHTLAHCFGQSVSKSTRVTGKLILQLHIQRNTWI